MCDVPLWGKHADERFEQSASERSYVSMCSPFDELELKPERVSTDPKVRLWLSQQGNSINHIELDEQAINLSYFSQWYTLTFQLRFNHAPRGRLDWQLVKHSCKWWVSRVIILLLLHVWLQALCIPTCMSMLDVEQAFINYWPFGEDLKKKNK